MTVEATASARRPSADRGDSLVIQDDMAVGRDGGIMDQSSIRSIVAQLTSRGPPVGALPEMPDVLGEELYRAADRCWRLLGREETRAALNRITLNQRGLNRRARVLKIAAMGLVSEQDLAQQLDPVVGRHLFAGLEALSFEQRLALFAARDALRRLRAFKAPGGAARYVAESVVSVGRGMQLKTPVDEAAVLGDIKARYEGARRGTKADIRDEICALHAISADVFYAIRRAHGLGRTKARA